MEDDVQAWEAEGGAVVQLGADIAEWLVTDRNAAAALQIKARVRAEFDRVVNALKSAADAQNGDKQIDARMVIFMLEQICAEVLSKDEAGYFIVEWQDASDHVRRIVTKDREARAHSTSTGIDELAERSACGGLAE